MALSKDDLLNAIADMSVMEGGERVQAMEEKGVVSAAAAVAAAAGARYLLTSADTADRVTADDLRHGAVVAAELAWAALTSETPIARHMTGAETTALLESP